MNQMENTSTSGTINPCTSRIQLPVNPCSGYPRNVTLLISVDNNDSPNAHAGKWPRDTKKSSVVR